MQFTVRKSGDLAGIAADIEKAAKQGQRDAAKAVAKEARTFVLDDVKRSRGGLRMRTGRLGVKVTVDATPVNSTVELRAAPAGPWTMVNTGTKPHTIKPRRRDVLAAGRGDIIGMSARHPGTRGGQYWTRATDRLDTELDDVVKAAVDRQMGQV